MVSRAVLIRAPLRIDFCGGFTDVPEIASSLGTAIVNAAVDLYEDPERKRPLEFAAELLPEGARSPVAANSDESLLAKFSEYLEHGMDARRCIFIRRDLPVSTGLGSSGTLSVMLIGAWLDYRHQRWCPAGIAAKARDFECRFLGLKGGYQDYLSAAAGGYHRFNEEPGDPRPRVLRGRLPACFARYLNHATIVIVAPRPYPSARIIADLVARLASDTDLRQRLSAIKACNEACARAIEAADLAAALRIVGEAAELRRDISPYGSNPTLDTVREELRSLYRAAHDSGAGGGSLIIYAREEALEALHCRVAELRNDLGVKIFFPKYNTRGLRMTPVAP